MAKFHDLLARVSDDGLRAALQTEYNQATKHKKFGLVFEEHLPECTPLWGMKIRRGMTVARKDGDFNDVLTVQRIKDGIATCWHASANAAEDIALEDLIPIARFGDPIYPVLTPIDAVENAPGDKLWHTLIQADNYHALQLLEYLYKGKVDCIYIDPPYNTGAHDWKYNNDYVDANDAYRHSKWLSMMQKRLRIAKKLLNPKDSVLIVTIDEKEYLHLGCLLEEMFPEARIQMVSSVINPAGAGRQTEFARTDEYIFYVQIGTSSVLPESKATEKDPIIWDSLRRSSLANARGKHGKGACGPNQFYPIYVDDATGKIAEIGEPIPEGVNRESAPKKVGCTAVFPVRKDGTEMNWGIKPQEAKERLKNGYLRAGKHTPEDPQQYVISYVTGGNIKDIQSGKAIFDGYDNDGCVKAFYPTGRDKMPTTNWSRASHDAQQYGTKIITPILGSRFPYPKSLYAEYDCLRFVIADKPNALVLDFFAGSGTTLHAVNLLNAEDGGTRQCIMVTNNEVSEAESKGLKEHGLKPGDEEWERLGIAKYVTWPRTVCSIEGHDVKGNPLKGNYGVEVDDFDVDDESAVVSKVTGKPIKKTIYKKTTRQMYPAMAEMAMADGFKANAAFFKLDFIDKDSVALGKQFKALLPILWMKSGAKGKRPTVTQQTPAMLVLPENEFAVLTDEGSFLEFEKQVKAAANIHDVYLVTDSNNAFKEMSLHFKDKRCIQLYRDYLDNFRINKGGR